MIMLEKDRLAAGKERYSFQNAKHWISTETGSHLLLDGDGNVVGGAGGALKGQKFIKVTRKGKDVEGGNNNDPRMDRYKSIKDRMTKGEFEGPENKEKKEIAKRLMKEYEAELGIDAKAPAQKSEPKGPAKEKAKAEKPIKSLLTDTSLLSTSPSAEMAKKAIARFYVDKPENIELIPVNDNLFKVQKKASGKILEGVQVSVAKGRYRFEMGKVAKENSSPIRVYRAAR